MMPRIDTFHLGEYGAGISQDEWVHEVDTTSNELLARLDFDSPHRRLLRSLSVSSTTLDYDFVH
jgi:hypothetical protein